MLYEIAFLYVFTLIAVASEWVQVDLAGAIIILLGGYTPLAGLASLLTMGYSVHGPVARRLESGSLALETVVDLFVLCLSFGYVWLASTMLMNRLMHALNGNINMARLRLMLLPFVIIIVVGFVLDICTGFRYGISGHVNVVVQVGGSRWNRLANNIGAFSRKFGALTPLYILFFIVSPVLFGLFIVYDTLVLLVYTIALPTSLVNRWHGFFMEVRLARGAREYELNDGTKPLSGVDDLPEELKKPRQPSPIFEGSGDRDGSDEGEQSDGETTPSGQATGNQMHLISGGGPSTVAPRPRPKSGHV